MQGFRLRKASDSLVDWEKKSRGLSKWRGFEIRDLDVMIRDLVSAIVRTHNLRRWIAYWFVAGVAVSALYGLPEIAKIRVPAEFLWFDLLNDLQSAIFDGEREVALTELDDVATRATGLIDLLDDVVSGEGDEVKNMRLKSAVKELETATSSLSVGLERVADGVSDTFRNVFTRNGVLENFRVGPDEKQRKCY